MYVSCVIRRSFNKCMAVELSLNKSYCTYNYSTDTSMSDIADGVKPKTFLSLSILFSLVQ